MSVSPLVSTVIQIVLLSTILLSLTVQPTQTSAIPFRTNMNKVFKEWSCNDPKPRLVYLEDEYDDYDPSVLYLPHALVVSRCEKSIGCCKPGQVCSPAEEEEMNFTVETYNRGKKQREHIKLINHLKCQCQNAVHDSPR